MTEPNDWTSPPRAVCRHCGKPIIFATFDWPYGARRDPRQWHHRNERGNRSITCSKAFSYPFRARETWPHAEPPLPAPIPLMSLIRRRTASRLGLRTPYSQPGFIRLRSLSPGDVEYMIDRFKQTLMADQYRVTVLADWDARSSRTYPFLAEHPWPTVRSL